MYLQCNTRINSCLEKFIQGWDNYPIEGTGNLTPNQHWIRGLFRVANSSRVGTIAKEVWENLSEVGTVCKSGLYYCNCSMMINNSEQTPDPMLIWS